MKPLLASTLALALALAVATSAAPARAAGRVPVVLVANAEGGTVSIVNTRRLQVVRELDVLPDGPRADADALHGAVGQSLIEAAGGLNYAQDQDVSPDGRTLYVSRGHRGDVAAFDIASGRLSWKVDVGGFRADHMTISPDGSRLYVSALTEQRVEVIDTRARRRVATFATGEWPHDNHVSHDGTHLFNASIGNILLSPEARGLRPDAYRLTVVDRRTLAPWRSYDFEEGIRPYVLADHDRRMYAQLSNFHGLIAYDLEQAREVGRLELPVDAGVTDEDYDFDAPHHGLAISPDERTLCAAGRASDYVALVETRRLRVRALVDVGDAPGWAATGPGGRRCFVPNTRADTLSVISFRTRRELARIPVGDGPKQVEAARLPRAALTGRCAATRPAPRRHVPAPSLTALRHAPGCR